MGYLPHHIAISVRNIDKSLVFYKKLGYKQVHRYDDETKTNVHLKLGNSYLEMFAYRSNADRPEVEYEYGNNLSELGVKHIALATTDTKAALADLKDKGLADDSTKIEDWGDVQFFFIKDPDGVWVEFIKDDRYS